MNCWRHSGLGCSRMLGQNTLIIQTRTMHLGCSWMLWQNALTIQKRIFVQYVWWYRVGLCSCSPFFLEFKESNEYVCLSNRMHVMSVHGRWQGWSRTYLWGFSCFSCVSEFIGPEHIPIFSLPATSIAKKPMLIGLPIINYRHIKDRDNNGSLKYWVSGTDCRWKKFLAQIYQSFRSHVQLSPWG